jgi:hypothetical protein
VQPYIEATRSIYKDLIRFVIRQYTYSILKIPTIFVLVSVQKDPETKKLKIVSFVFKVEVFVSLFFFLLSSRFIFRKTRLKNVTFQFEGREKCQNLPEQHGARAGLLLPGGGSHQEARDCSVPSIRRAALYRLIFQIIIFLYAVQKFYISQTRLLYARYRCNFKINNKKRVFLI